MDVAERYGHFQWSSDHLGLVLEGTSAPDETALLPYANFPVRMPCTSSSAVRMGCIDKFGRLLRNAGSFQPLET